MKLFSQVHSNCNCFQCQHMHTHCCSTACSGQDSCVFKICSNVCLDKVIFVSVQWIVFVCLSGCVRLSADRCVSPHHSSCQRSRRAGGDETPVKDTGWLLLSPSYFLCAHSLVGVLEKSYVGQRQPAANSPPLPLSVTLQMKKIPHLT